MFGRDILILVAHPDDEVVACAASIARARAAGSRVSTLYLTHGCLAREVMWPWQRKRHDAAVATRRAEGEAAARALGVVPLGWSSRPARHLWRELPQVWDDVQAVLARRTYDQVWVPAYEGGNPDHDALNALGARLKESFDVWEFAEYNFFGGKARLNRFVSSDETLRTIVLTPAEHLWKRNLLGLYESENDNLFYVKAEQESCRPLAVYDYAQPPHQGVLWYARFQWVPFRHPRVDFTKAAEVSAAIEKFLTIHAQQGG